MLGPQCPGKQNAALIASGPLPLSAKGADYPALTRMRVAGREFRNPPPSK
jgi:hypothetical protein